MKDTVSKRIAIVFMGISLCMLILLVQAFRLQVLPSKRIAKMAERQYMTEIKLSSKRGEIYDRNKEALATTVEVDSLYASPRLIKNKKKIAKILSKKLDLQYLRVLSSISNKKYFVWIKRTLTEAESESLKVLIKENKGLSVIKEPKRVYPYNSLASHVLGFVGIDSNGLCGVEKHYDSFLKGDDSKTKYEKDAKGRPIYEGKNIFSVDYSGNSLYLTIDSSLQYRVEAELKASVEKWKAKSGTVIIMDPSNGEILSLANYPDYDPNSPGQFSLFSRRNRAVTDVFEPGSIFKIVTAALALNNNIIDTKTKIWGENGRLQIGTGKYARTIKEASGHDYGWMTLGELIEKSSNVGSAKLGIMIGEDLMYSGINSFGFGTHTGIDLPGEVRGILNTSGTEMTLATMAFGQGIAVTPVQMLRAYSIIANGGYDITPHVVKSIASEDGKEIFAYSGSKKGESIITEKISKELAAMLRMVVESGTGTATDISGFEVGGKTGTAQKPDPKKGGYSADKYIANFAGFFPASAPEYAIMVIIDEPDGAYYASTVAVPLFRKVVNLLIQNRRVIPKNIEVVKKEEKINEVTIAENKKEEEVLQINRNEFNNPNYVPNVKGLTLREALSSLSDEWEDVVINGTGKISKQLPLPGERKKEDKIITLWLE